MAEGSKIFLPCRKLGYVSNHIPLKVRFIKSRQENLITTCVGKAFHTYGMSHFGLLSVSSLHDGEITAMGADAYHVYTACDKQIFAWRRGTELKHVYRTHKKTIHLLLPFGAHLISIDRSSSLKIWNIKEETLFLEMTFSNNTFEISTILHPSTYINKILLGSQQGEMQLWNINTLKMIYSFKGWKSAISCLEQAPAMDVVAVGLANGKIILHNIKLDETIMEFVQDWGLVTSIVFRTDGSPTMLSGSVVGHIVLWDLEERRVISQLLSAHHGSVTGMACLPNEPLMVTSSPDNTLKLWIFDMADGGARLFKIREGHLSPPCHIRFYGPNGHNILSAGSDSTLRIFNTQNEQFNKSLGRASHNRKSSKKQRKSINDPLTLPAITDFSFQTTREKEWDNIASIHLGSPLVTTWSYHKLKMGDLKLLPEKFHKKNLVIEDLKEVAATSLYLTHCGNFVIIGYNTGHVYRFNIQSGILRDNYGNPKAHNSAIRGLASDSLNQMVITGGSDCKIKFWSFKNKGTRPLTTLTMDEQVSLFHIHHEGSMLASALEHFDIYIIDVDCRRIVRKFVGHNAQITDIAFSPDLQWLITAAMDGSIRTWSIPTGQLIDEFFTKFPCVSLNMSPCGDVLATAHVDHLGLWLWSNSKLYTKISLKRFKDFDKDMLVQPEQSSVVIKDEDDFVSLKQISKELVTLSGLTMSHSQNLVNLDLIKFRNKPKTVSKVHKSAPFFLPTVSGLTMQYDLKTDQVESGSKILTSSVINLTNFGTLLLKCNDESDIVEIVDKLKGYSPSTIDFEIKSLEPETGGSVDVLLKFLMCLEYMLKANIDFELAEACLSVFLKNFGSLVAKNEVLRNYLSNVQSCHSTVWHRIQSELLYNICIIQNLKNM